MGARVTKRRGPRKPSVARLRISRAAIDAYVGSSFARKATLRVSELAQELGVARGTLVDTFKQLHRMTPGKYFREQQVRCAKELLRRGWSIERVASHAGYATRRAFCRSFRAQTGMTPTAYQLEQNVPRQDTVIVIDSPANREH